MSKTYLMNPASYPIPENLSKLYQCDSNFTLANQRVITRKAQNVPQRISKQEHVWNKNKYDEPPTLCLIIPSKSYQSDSKFTLADQRVITRKAQNVPQRISKQEHVWNKNKFDEPPTLFLIIPSHHPRSLFSLLFFSTQHN